MSEQAKLIPKIPPIRDPDPKVVEVVVPPENTPTVVPPETSGESGRAVTNSSEVVPNDGAVVPDDGVVVPDANTAVPKDSAVITEASTVVPEETSPLVESSDTITPFQGITYASFILTFCLAGFAAVAVFRKASKALSVKRFSIGAKMLSLGYLAIAFNGTFGTYLYSRFLNEGDAVFPLIVPILSWILVGPAIAVVLNSLLTREDAPDFKKMIFDAFTYLVIFGCVAASQVPSLKSQEPMVFSFLGAFFFIVPIIRFLASLKIAKGYHPELHEMFVQILIRSLLLLPLLLPFVVFTSVYDLVSHDLTLLLFNLVTSVFVLMTGLLMIISIDYITQGINADQLVAIKADSPIAPSEPKTGVPPTTPVLPDGPVTPTVQKTLAPASNKPAEPKLAVPAESVHSAEPSDEEPSVPSDSLEESMDTLEFDIERLDSTVIDFEASQSSTDESKGIGSKSSKSVKGKKTLQKPKAPQPPKTSKATDSQMRIKPPEKPKKRL